MQKKINCLLFSDFEIPSYKRIYRGVLLIDSANVEKYNFTTVSPYTKDTFINKKANIQKKYFKLFFKNHNFQYSFISRTERIIKLFFTLFKIRHLDFDIIYVGGSYLLPFAKFLKKTNSKIIINLCDFYSDLYVEYQMPFGKYLKNIIRCLEKKFLSYADFITVDTYAYKDLLVKNYNIKEEKCIVLPNGIDVKKFPYLKNKDKKILESYGFKEEDKVIFYGGDISHVDNIEMILEFANEYKTKNFKFLIIGKGNNKYLEKLKDYISKNNLKNNVVIEGFKPYDDLYKYISIADVCLAPFKITETTNVTESSKIITYLLSGKKILATRAKGVESLYGKYIYYLDKGDYTEFKDKLLKLLKKKITENEKEVIRNHGLKFDFNLIIKQELKLIEDITLGSKIKDYNLKI
jgi:glycosyltransferase involved in cell wall biosynthesis